MSEPHPVVPKRSLRAIVALLVVTVLWGWTFVWMKQGVVAAERVLGPDQGTLGVALFMALRFGIAAPLVLLLPGARRGLTKGAWVGGGWIGLLLLAGFLMQMLGLQEVSPPVSAFLTSLYVVFTALMTAAIRRRRVGAALVVGTLLATFGAGFIGGPPQLTFGHGEWLTVGCAFVFAVHILVTDSVTRRHDPLALTFSSILVVALGSAVLAGFSLLGEGAAPVDRVLELVRDREFLLPMLAASLLATVLALSLMNLFQREVDPVRAAILYAIEPVWASLIALALGLARADRWLWIGGAALLVGNLAAELGPRWWRGRSGRRGPREGLAGGGGDSGKAAG